MSRRRLIAEVVAVLLLAGVSFMAGRAAFAASPWQPFAQAEFGAAVMLASGRGFVNPHPVPGGALQRFLLMESDTIATGAIDLTGTSEPTQFQNMHRYLMAVVGTWWRVSQISWHRLAEVAGALHAVAVVAVFVLLRLFLPAIPALVGAAWLASSPLQLLYAPHLRDFAKGAFVLATLPAVVALVLSGPSRRRLSALAATTGAVIGIGIGFRMDVAILAPIAAVSVVLFRGSRPWRAIGDKALAIAVLLATVLACSWPVLSRLSTGGSNAFHVVLLGNADWFDSRLAVEPASYGYLPFYSDTYLTNVVRVRSAADTGQDVTMPSREYDAASFDLWRQWLRQFPADSYTRLLAAADGVLNLAFNNPTPESAGRWPVAVALGDVFAWLNRWHGWGWLLGVVLVAAAAMGGISRALFATLVLIALVGYPSLQYDPRHYFHLQAIPIVVIVAALWTTGQRSLALLRRRADAAKDVEPSAALRRSLVTAVVVGLLVTVVPATTTRAYQSAHLTQTFSEFLRSEGSPVATEFVALAPNRWLARWPDVEGVTTGVDGLKSAYYVAEFKAAGAADALAIGLRYNFAPAGTPCAVVRRLVTGAGTAHFGFPVYSLRGDSSFEGIEMGPEMRRRLVGIRRLAAGPGGLPIELRLAADWEDRRLWQRLVKEERLRPDDVGVGVTGPANQCGSQLAYLDATLDAHLAVVPGRIATAAPNVAVGRDALEVTGQADASAPALVTFKPVNMAAGDALVARLWIQDGGVTLRLRMSGVIAREVSIPRPGLTVVALPVSESGTYVPEIASAPPGWRRAQHFTLDRLGILGADGRVATGEVEP